MDSESVIALAVLAVFISAISYTSDWRVTRLPERLYMKSSCQLGPNRPQNWGIECQRY